MSNNNEMKNLVFKINQLQDLFCKFGENLDIERFMLPQIVVIGGQSVGKSSVLENIVSKNFIPRGNGIVTRCPLYLQLINDNNCKGYGEFLHKPSKKFTNFKEIQTEIEKQTEKLAGKEGISAEPITLKIHSNKDLPGLVEVAVRNQSENIAEDIKDVALKYIKEENSLILAVSSATEDLANSVSLKLAKQVDPQKRRTIGIITKLDLVQDKDKMRIMIDILNNNFYPLKLGHIGVYNMSNEDLINKKSIDDFLQEQEQFFKTNNIFVPVVDKVGTQNLQKVLSTELSNHIKQIVPSFRNMINDRIREAKAELAQYGDNETDDKNNMLNLNKLLHKLNKTFDKEIGKSGNVDLDWSDVSIGAKIGHILNKQYAEKIMAVETDPNIMTKFARLLLNHSGIHLPNIIPQESFHAAIIKLTEKYLPISLDIVEEISEEMQILIDFCNDDLKIFPSLRDMIDKEIKNHIRKVTKVTKDKIKEMIKIECSYINTEHKDFCQMKDILSAQISVNSHQSSASNSTKEAKDFKEVYYGIVEFEENGEQNEVDEEDEDLNASDMSRIVKQMKSSPSTQLLYKMSMDYIKIIVTTLTDYLPKLVMYSMVKSTQSFLEVELLVNVLQQCDITTILSLGEDEKIKKEKLSEKIKICKEALKIMNNI